VKQFHIPSKLYKSFRTVDFLAFVWMRSTSLLRYYDR
jgi:hypothetical protein